jgi:hypothetical protein
VRVLSRRPAATGDIFPREIHHRVDARERSRIDFTFRRMPSKLIPPLRLAPHQTPDFMPLRLQKRRERTSNQA